MLQITMSEYKGIMKLMRIMAENFHPTSEYSDFILSN